METKKTIKKRHTIAEVGTILSLSRSQVNRLIHRGDLIRVKEGRAARITHESLDGYLHRQEAA